MKIVIWIAQIAVIGMMLLSGFAKSVLPYDEMLKEMPWVEDFSLIQIRIIAIAEFILALTLFLPIFMKKIPKIWMAYSAFGLALIMLGAVGTHTIRGEVFPPSIIMLIFSSFVGWKRYEEFKS